MEVLAITEKIFISRLNFCNHENNQISSGLVFAYAHHV